METTQIRKFLTTHKRKKRYARVEEEDGEGEEEEEHEEDKDEGNIAYPAITSSTIDRAKNERNIQSYCWNIPSYFLNLSSKISSDWNECLKSIKNFPIDIYWIFALKFLESYSYFALSQILVIYLHTEFHVSDIEAGMVYGMWGAAITLWGLMVSWVNDNLGVKKSLMLGFTISAISSTFVASTTSKIFLYITIFAIYPFGTSMGIPMLTVAIKRYTTSKRRGFAFGLYYSVMNIAALVSGPVVDILNIGIRNGLTIGNLHLSGNRLVILTCTLSNLISLYIAIRYIREIKITEEVEVDGVGENNPPKETITASKYTIGSDSEDDEDFNNLETSDEMRGNGVELVKLNHAPPSDAQEPSRDEPQEVVPSNIQEYKPTQHNPYDTIRELLHSPTFWRFAILTLLLVNLHAIFRHLDATEPTYLIRCFGSNVPKGTLYSINPFMIIFLTPLVAMLTSTYNHFDMIKWGGYLTAASPFFPAFSTTIWAIIAMNVLLSLGEAIWSPRLYDYVMTIAPEGKEASFSALASAPLFAAKIPVGLMSGYLLATYLPEDGRQHPQKMWLVIGLLTMTSPILITLFDPCIREPTHTKNIISDGEQSAALPPHPHGVQLSTRENDVENVLNSSY